MELEYANLSRTQAQQRIYNELKRAGVDINSHAGQQIAELVTAIEAENRALELNRETLEQLEDRQKAVKEGQEYLISSAADVGAAFVEGSENAIEALKRLAIQIVAAAAQAKLLGTGPLAGLFGGSFGAIAGNANLSPGANALARAGRGGLFARGGITNRPAIFGEHGPEAAIPLPDGKTVPVTLNDRNFRQAQPVIHYAPTLNIDARGADMAAVARIERGMDERDRNFRENVLGVLQSANSRNRPVALTS